MRFRKKLVVIEAVRWTGHNDAEMRRFVPIHVGGPLAGQYHIRTLEGALFATPGDWIIKGVAGEFYPCKPDIFEKTYEPEGEEPCQPPPR